MFPKQKNRCQSRPQLQQGPKKDCRRNRDRTAYHILGQTLICNRPQTEGRQHSLHLRKFGAFQPLRHGMLSCGIRKGRKNQKCKAADRFLHRNAKINISFMRCTYRNIRTLISMTLHNDCRMRHAMSPCAQGPDHLHAMPVRNASHAIRKTCRAIAETDPGQDFRRQVRTTVHYRQK